MAVTKTNVQAREWNQLPAASMSVCGNIDVSTCFKAGLSVVVCPIETIAHANGVLIVVETRIGLHDEDWRVLYELRMGAGTAHTCNVDVEAAAEAVVVPVDSTTDFEILGDKYLVHNVSIDANSEIVRNNGFEDNVDIDIVDGLKNIQQTSANLYDIVAEKYFPLPDEVSTARVFALNDDADCDTLWRVDLAKITAVA